MKVQKKSVYLFFICLIVLIFLLPELNKYLNFDFIKNHRQNFFDFYQQNPFKTLFIYTSVYITATALSLPGAVLLTLLGGTLFGVFIGTFIVSLASTTGATLAFLVSRFFFKDQVQKRFGPSLKKINKGIENEGAFYLFTLRLIPLFPFFAVNLIMGLTPMGTRTFFFVSQAGMLPATIIFVNAGTQLAKIQSVEDLLSPSLIFAFSLIGFLPITTKKILKFINKKPVQ